MNEKSELQASYDRVASQYAEAFLIVLRFICTFNIADELLSRAQLEQVCSVEISMEI